MRNLIYSVVVHSCPTEPTVSLKDTLVDGFKYVLDGPDPKDLFRPLQVTEGHQYFALKIKPTKDGDIQRCNCRQLMGYADAIELLQNGNAKAIWELNKKHERMELYQHEKPVKDSDGNRIGTILETHIWRAQQTKVPRVDLVSQADIERAYSNPLVVWAVESVLHGRRDFPFETLEDDPTLSKRYSRYIDEIHKLYMDNRKKLIVPFKSDPTEGRLLFPFPPDERTKGGH